MRTIISLIPNDQSQVLLREYTKKIGKEERKFHSTIYYSEKTPLFKRKKIYRELESFLEITIKPKFKFDTFGKKGSDLVLRYTNGKVIELNKMLINEAVLQMIKWPNLSEEEREILEAYNQPICGEIHYYDFNPHITLVQGWNGGVKRLPDFREKLVFDKIYWEFKK
ncbi:MAG: hypothetical protein ABIA78_03125 [archaeon]